MSWVDTRHTTFTCLAFLFDIDLHGVNVYVEVDGIAVFHASRLAAQKSGGHGALEVGGVIPAESQ